MNPIRILLVDDHELVREALQVSLDLADDMQVVAQASSGTEALARITDAAPDVVVLDIAMPDMNGFEAARHIRQDHPRVGVVALSAHSDKLYVLSMLEAGAHGYVVKSGVAEELPAAIREVAKGHSYLSPGVAGALIDSYVGRLFPTETSVCSLLGAREREVIQLLAEGATSKAIGHRLSISVRTVEAHRRNIMRKLDLHTVAELTKFAVREGLTSPDP